MPDQRYHTSTRCLHVVRFSALELRNAIGQVIEHPHTEDFLDGLSYMPDDPIPYTGRAQSIDAEGRVILEGFFHVVAKGFEVWVGHSRGYYETVGQRRGFPEV